MCAFSSRVIESSFSIFTLFEFAETDSLDMVSFYVCALFLELSIGFQFSALSWLD